MTLLLHVHSGFRYVVLLLGLLTLLYALVDATRRRPANPRLRRLASAFAGSFHVQILLGLALLFSGRFGGIVAGHVLVMILSAASAQVVPSVMRRRPPELRTALPYAIGALLALSLASLGILALGRPIVG